MQWTINNAIMFLLLLSCFGTKLCHDFAINDNGTEGKSFGGNDSIRFDWILLRNRFAFVTF